MAALENSSTDNEKKIIIRPNGSYKIYGRIPLVHKTQIVSEYGEPLTWQKDGTYETKEPYSLCRCGHSEQKPFCDGTHRKIGFDGTETAATNNTAERQETLEGGQHIVVKYDDSLCMNSGFCGNRLEDIRKMLLKSGNPEVRAQIMAMIERCPSGAYVYSVEANGPEIEPDLPQHIAVTTEITSEGPIDGPIWVMGNIPIERSDGQPFETRNRVTLCNCGRSAIKPLCDGTHRNGH